jgi:hypothetical protein
MWSKIACTLSLAGCGAAAPANVHRPWEPYFYHLDRCELFQYRRGRQPRRMDHQTVLQSNLQAVGQERNQDVCVSPMFELMIDGADA